MLGEVQLNVQENMFGGQLETDFELCDLGQVTDSLYDFIFFHEMG